MLDADLKSDPTPIHIVKLGYHFMYEDSQGRAEALFSKQSWAKQYLHAASYAA